MSDPVNGIRIILPLTKQFRVSRLPALMLWLISWRIATSAVCAATDSYPTTFSGNVSWYGPNFHGKLTASGERFDMNKLTAASRSLPLGTRVLVENPRNGKSVIVTINDRGPYIKGRILDLSREAARRLDILLGGVAYVDCTVLSQGHSRR